jgi:ADP-heptose:LPS heptosyltransferase
MKISKKINVIRRNLTHLITKNIGNSQLNQNTDYIDNAKIKRILICRPNQRLGNLLLITPLIQEITSIFPQCKIDLFAKGTLAPIIFENYENINLVFELPKKPFKTLIQYFKVWATIRKQHYDIVINVDKNSSSGRLATLFANSKYKFFGDAVEDIQLKYEDYEHIAKYPIYNFRNYLTQLEIEINETPIPSLDLKLSSIEIAEGKKLLNDIINNEKNTICIFTFATGEKCYSESWWETFYERLKKEYSNYNIIEVLPVENVSQIAFKAPTFYSKDIRQIGSLIANTELFIGADSGIMHLASSVQTTTVGLFSGTNINKYQPYNNNSVAINTNINEVDGWVKIINKILISN